MTAGAGEHRGDVVANYFENLLPDSADIRKRLGARFKTRSASTFDLLRGRVVFLVWTERQDADHLISCRYADRSQVKAYFENL